jgi:WXG100 family type VII secretion target
MADRRLDINTDSLTDVGQTCGDLAEYVRDILDSMNNTINQVTSKEEWNSASATEYSDKFREIYPRLDNNLSQLEALGPKLKEVAGGYEETEQTNMSQMEDVGGVR